MNYQEFIKRKAVLEKPCGIEKDYPLNPKLFPFQAACVKWALRRGRAGLFLSTGLGKTFCQLEWARVICEHTGKNVLILAPLAVSAQTAAEGENLGIAVQRCRSQADVKPGINITNYELLHHFNLSDFKGVVLDEASILKDHTSATRKEVISRCSDIPFRLSCTATPAPNDFVELGNQAEFLGVQTRTDMLSTFFNHDGSDTKRWYLKGHGEDAFWKWMANWSICINKPSDIGFSDDGYNLPELRIHTHILETDRFANGCLIPLPAVTLTEQRKVKRNSIDNRVLACADLVASTPGHWIVWGELNDECDMLEQEISGAVQVAGRDDLDDKETRLMEFATGKHRVLVSKSSICGHGMNFQVCHQMAFVNLTHSFESQFQAVRRIWRFGQKHPCDVHIFLTDLETSILDNVRRKEQEAAKMVTNMIEHMREMMRAEIGIAPAREKTPYEPKMTMEAPRWLR